ncbi:MAG: phosphopantetheine-binding protein [Eubacterium sp.]
MEKLIEILEDIQPDADYETCTTLIDDHILDSLSIIALVAEIEDEFDIVIPTVEIVPDNFNSAQALWNLITRLQEED